MDFIKNTKLLRVCAYGCALWILIFWVGSCSKKEKNDPGVNVSERIIKNASVGKDPHSYRTSKGMMSGTVMRKTLDAVSMQIVQRLNKRLEQPDSLTVNDILNYMIELNPYRYNKEVKDVVRRCSIIVAKRAGRSFKEMESFYKIANRYYSEGNFTEAVRMYTRVLDSSPGYLDAWNNLALTEMHLSNDLAALFALGTVRLRDLDYLPAMINLTVLYERLGLREGARKMARAATNKPISSEGLVPAVVYNIAWYMTLDGRHARAKDVLEPLTTYELDEKHKELYRLNVLALGNKATEHDSNR